MKNVILPYQFKVSEEIARWSLEIYIDHNPELGWWIAFTNPTAGPWKTISSIDTDGKIEEIYRFAREENRPDLLLVSDKRKEILIIEAKELAQSLVVGNQMTKSIAVINDMTTMLQGLDHGSWSDRKKYKITPGFLWYCENEKNALDENKKVNNYYQKHNSFNLGETLNIVILQKDNILFPVFIKDNKIKTNINL